MSRSRATLLLAACALLVPAPTANAQAINRTAEATGLAFTPDGKTLFSASMTGSVRVWDVSTNGERERFDAHRDGTFGLALSPDGKVLATAGGDGLVRLWDARTRKPLRELRGHRQEVFAVALSPDGKTVASGGADKTIRLWDAATGKLLRTFHGHELKVTGLAFAPDGKVLASGGTATATIPGFFVGATHSDQIHLWDAATGQPLRKLDVRGTLVAFAGDGQTVAGGGLFMTGQPVGGGVTIQGGPRVGVATPDGQTRLPITGQGGSMAYSPDGKFLATAWGSRIHAGRFVIENQTRHRRVALWELASGTELLQLPEENAPLVAISPDCRKVAVGRADGTVRFHEIGRAGWAAGKNADALGAAGLARLWEELGGKDAKTAYEAQWALVEVGEKTVGLLRARLAPAVSAGPRVKQFLANLDSKRFAVREAAFRELKKLGPAIEADLREALREKLSSEVRTRVESLLAPLNRHPATPEELRQTRALQVLERIGTEEAQAVLRRVAEGAPGAWVTGEARAVLERLDRRMRLSP